MKRLLKTMLHNYKKDLVHFWRESAVPTLIILMVIAMIIAVLALTVFGLVYLMHIVYDVHSMIVVVLSIAAMLLEIVFFAWTINVYNEAKKQIKEENSELVGCFDSSNSDIDSTMQQIEDYGNRRY